MRPNVEAPRDERSLGELFADLTHESSELVRKEIELARLGFAETATEMKAGIISMAAGGAIVLAGLMVLLLAAVRALDPLMPNAWLSPLIVGGVVLLIGVGALLFGRRSVRDADVVPKETVESLRDDKEMLQRHVTGTPSNGSPRDRTDHH